MIQKTIPPVDRNLLESELSPAKFLRPTNNGNKEIYIFSHHDSPNLMQEIGRLREISFRDAGGGTGLELDLDEFDLSEDPYKQLIVWSPQDREIVGGYRFIEGSLIPLIDGQPHCATAELFHFSDRFLEEYLPHMIELGRSFVQPAFQPTFNIRKGMYSLDNLWDGLGALTIDFPEIKYFFGKITMYPRFNILARDMILYFLDKYFADREKLVTPIHALDLVTDMQELEDIFTSNSYDEDYKTLMKNVRRLNENIPPLVNAYMNLSPTMKVYGTAINHSFGEVEETGILITIDDIYDFKKERHVADYEPRQQR
jgi:hypothetical protein